MDSQRCLERLHALQSILNPGTAPIVEGSKSALSAVDALLFIGGIDGKNHAGSREALNWLLPG